MLELIALIIFIVSFSGIALFFVYKIPVLREIEVTGKGKISLGVKTQKGLKKVGSAVLNAPRSIRWDILFQKALSRARVLALKAENKSGSLLVRMREQSRQRKEQEIDNEDYWQQVGRFSLKKKRKRKQKKPG